METETETCSIMVEENNFRGFKLQYRGTNRIATKQNVSG
jgi:hypothetical protein